MPFPKPFGTNDVGAAIGSRGISGTAIATAGCLPVGKLGRAAKLVASERLLGEAVAGVGTRVSIAEQDQRRRSALRVDW